MYVYTHCSISLLIIVAGTDPASLTDDEQSSPHIVVEVGVFGGEAVSETAQNICEELNGMAVGRMGPRILYMVN